MKSLAIAAALFVIPALADPVTYAIDPVHSHIGFSVGHLGIGRVHGQFREYSGELAYQTAPVTSLVATVNIKTASVDTGHDARDKHLRSGDFLDAERHPDMSFVSRAIEHEDGEARLVGTLTMAGVFQKIRLPVTVRGPVKDMDGKERIGLSARGTVQRHDFGMATNAPLDQMIGREVDLMIDLEAVAQPPAAKR